jgi:hypothetical protein
MWWTLALNTRAAVEPFRTVRVFVSVTNVAAIANVITGSVMILNPTPRREAATTAVVRRTAGWAARSVASAITGMATITIATSVTFP